MASPSLAMVSPAMLPWMGDILHPTHPTTALHQPTSPERHHKVKYSSCPRVLETSVCMIEREGHQATCDALQAFTELFPWRVPPASCHVIVHVCVRKALCLCILINLNCPFISSCGFTHFPTSLCICCLSFFSCISGYSPFTSFPSKAVAANPVSDLSSPLDLGNCLLSFSHSFHTPHAQQSSNPLCTCRLILTSMSFSRSTIDNNLLNLLKASHCH